LRRLPWLILALAGALVCTVCDHLHVVTGVLHYRSPWVWQQAFWVPLLFAGASLLIVAGAGPVVTLLRVGEAPPSPREVAGDALQFVAAYAFTAYGSGEPTVVATVLSAWWLGRMVRERRPWMIPYSIAVAIGGTLFEATLSSTGAFTYRAPDMLGVPRWLPALYLHVALLGGSLQLLLAPRPARA
jgi:hypothetical protein